MPADLRILISPVVFNVYGTLKQRATSLHPYDSRGSFCANNVSCANERRFATRNRDW
jgi:hypothetical protein